MCMSWENAMAKVGQPVGLVTVPELPGNVSSNSSTKYYVPMSLSMSVNDSYCALV